MLMTLLTVLLLALEYVVLLSLLPVLVELQLLLEETESPPEASDGRDE